MLAATSVTIDSEAVRRLGRPSALLKEAKRGRCPAHKRSFDWRATRKAAELMLAATSVTIDSEAVRRLGRRKRRREGVAQLDWSPVEVRQADWREARNNREGLDQDNGWTASLDAIQAKDRPQRKCVIDVGMFIDE